ncbi:carbohydrate ABC transporter permease [Paenibacillus silvisoli]|uniref:carbohydrate ABC transporter permease n=1 Tax=Paenibacillus silvisoli TaxID=3110539 RepID=UPI0028041299|nr:carbohydrate ABC transporter permease [Paenibacillus silvisoli]
MKKNPIASQMKGRSFDAANLAFMIVLGLLTLFPFYYMFIISIADYADIRRQLIYIIPTSINLSSYAIVFKTRYFLNSFLISVLVTVIGTIFSMLVTTPAAYTLSKRSIPGWKMMYTLAIIPLVISGGLIPYYLTVKAVGLVNSFWVLVIPAALAPFYLIILKNFFDDLPESLEESAKIDGANDIYILYRIVLPVSAPVIATISLFYAVDRWNDYYSAVLFVSNQKLYPLQMVLREVLLNFEMLKGSAVGAAIAEQNRTSYVYSQSLKMAIVVVATLPILLVYPFLQKYFTKGIMIGAVKE